MEDAPHQGQPARPIRTPRQPRLPVEGMMPLLYGATGWVNTEAFFPRDRLMPRPAQR
jgi:hypothetical protein